LPKVMASWPEANRGPIYVESTIWLAGGVTLSLLIRSAMNCTACTAAGEAIVTLVGLLLLSESSPPFSQTSSRHPLVSKATPYWRTRLPSRTVILRPIGRTSFQLQVLGGTGPPPRRHSPREE